MNIKLKKSEQGSILVYSVLALAVILGISLSLMGIFLPKLRSIIDVKHSTNAIFAADSAIEWCLYSQRGNLAGGLLTFSNGAVYSIYYAGNPVATCDPTQSPLNHRAVGQFGSVGRSFEISE